MKKIWIAAGVLLAGVAASYWWWAGGETAETSLLAPVKKGDFEIAINATGELEAKNSVEIVGPTTMQTVQIWQTKIADLIPEGSVVKKGDYVARLDETELGNKLNDAANNLQKAEAQFAQNQLDTALTLRAARDEINNHQFTLREKEIVLEQSKFEPPATIRQAEIDLERTKRTLKQSQENYLIKQRQGAAKMSEASANLSQARQRLDMIQAIARQFTIYAPEAGMIIYQRNWDGRKITTGSNIDAWRPVVAKLPDMSLMLSRTFVNEVDIRKIKKDQFVHIGLDAFPEKKLVGKVTSVANIGEQRPNSDAKVFEVLVQLTQSDSILRPAMTTSNRIVAGTIKNVLSIPLEALHSQGDSLTFVYKKEGASYQKTEVFTAETNENEVVVTAGLAESDQVYLSAPPNAEQQTVQRLPASTKKLTARR
ncbi:MAG: HlyD family efflux transporter periplasmic adaptor subunit [Bernardetiaceae bacterium]|jgi:multidrug efflux pump subunit AcrA (membrane-fusion protein)|nr:HlyD family efflux transporter periplasmic adaptor subunit [Bernardetiaceae bacterium]